MDFQKGGQMLPRLSVRLALGGFILRSHARLFAARR
jgi:hypothetical protein